MSREIEVVPINLYDAGYIMANLRGPDRHELNAMFAVRDDAYWAEIAFHTATLGWVAKLSVDEYFARPVAMWAVQQLFGSAMSIWMVATDQFPLVAATAMKHFVRVLGPEVRARGVRRLEARSIDSHTEAHAWMERLGAVREGELLDNGLNGETFYLYAWRLSDFKPAHANGHRPFQTGYRAEIVRTVASTL